MKDIHGLRQAPGAEKAELTSADSPASIHFRHLSKASLIELGIHVDGPSAADHPIAIVLAGCGPPGIAGTCYPSAVPQWVAEQWRRYSFDPVSVTKYRLSTVSFFYAAHKVAEFFGLVFRQWISLLFHTLCRYIQFNRHN